MFLIIIGWLFFIEYLDHPCRLRFYYLYPKNHTDMVDYLIYNGFSFERNVHVSSGKGPTVILATTKELLLHVESPDFNCLAVTDKHSFIYSPAWLKDSFLKTDSGVLHTLLRINDYEIRSYNCTS